MEAAALAEPLNIHAEIEAEGSFEASLKVQAVLGPKTKIEAEGQLLGRPAAFKLESDGRQMRWGQQVEPQSATFSEGIVLSFTRLGLLKDLIWIAGGQPPEGSGGSVRAWLTVSDFSLGPPKTVNGVHGITIRYRVAISGEPVGSVDLVLDPATVRPLERSATVQFQGTMRYTERYRYPAPKKKSK